MSTPDQDAELEAFLKRRSPLHRQLADFDHAEPSSEVDRLVLNRARAAIEVPAQPPMFRTSRWAMPVGLAAAILIAFTVVLNIDHGRQAPLEKEAAAAKLEQPAAPAAQLTMNRARTAVEDARVSADSSAVAASAPVTATPRSPASPAPPPPPPPAYQASADSWLLEINRLRAAGKTAEADRELTAFRQAYPGHPSYSLARPPTR